MRASRTTHRTLPLEPSPLHVCVKGLAKNFLDWSALLHRQHFETLPAVFGEAECDTWKTA